MVPLESAAPTQGKVPFRSVDLRHPGSVGAEISRLGLRRSPPSTTPARHGPWERDDDNRSERQGRPANDVAHQELLLDDGRNGGPMVPYKALWSILLLGWLISYADRTVTGPVISWMIANKAGFIGDATNPATLGGLVGSMFFTGYMLTQYAGGRLGDRYGHREMLVLSLIWAGLMTLVSGLAAGLVTFVAARVLTGLGEGTFYSNDRTMVINYTPTARRTLGWVSCSPACRSASPSACWRPRTSSTGAARSASAARRGGCRLGVRPGVAPRRARHLPVLPGPGRPAAAARTTGAAADALLGADRGRDRRAVRRRRDLPVAGVAHRHRHRRPRPGGHRVGHPRRRPRASPRRCSTATSGTSTSPSSRCCGTCGSSASGRCRSSRRPRTAASSPPV